MLRYYILDKLDGHKPKAVSLNKWGAWFEHAERHVADDHIGGVWVSTVFLGLDHSFGEGPPLLFETMVFGGPLDNEMQRYSTWAQAEVGHQEILSKVRAATVAPASGSR